MHDHGWLAALATNKNIDARLRSVCWAIALSMQDGCGLTLLTSRSTIALCRAQLATADQ